MLEHHSSSRLLRSTALISVALLIAGSFFSPVLASKLGGRESGRTPVAFRETSPTRRSSVGLDLVRVATNGEAQVPTFGGPGYSSFNLDSTRFVLEKGGKSILYGFDPSTLA